MVRNILEYLETSARSCPEKTAFEDLEDRYTYREVLEHARRIGSALLSKLPGNMPVPVLMEKEARTLNVFMGAVCAGCFLYVGGTGAAPGANRYDPSDAGSQTARDHAEGGKADGSVRL